MKRDRIGRPVRLGSIVEHRVSRELGFVEEFVGRTRIRVRKRRVNRPGMIDAVWYVDQTMLEVF